jgi:curved DNA-binding protein CbpA
MASPRSPYDVLNVSPDAELVVIEAAYRALMKKYHPDQAAAAAEGPSAAEINQAFAVLRDAGRRAEYDQREWRRQQNMLIAQYQPAPPPRRRAFGWSGWFVALLLGGIIAAMVNGRGGLIVPSVGNSAMAAGEPDHRSQPTKIEPVFSAVAGRSAIEREIMAEARRPIRLRRGEAPAADLPYILVEEPGGTVRAVPAPRRVRAKPPRRRAAAGPAKAEEEDFLKREGYIY